jgi:hypothetical protein
MKYFDFETLKHWADLWDRGEQTILLAIIVFLVYTLFKLFLYWDN